MDEERRQELELEIARNREKEEIRLRAKGAADRMESERVARIVAAAEEADRKLEEQKAAQDFQRQLTLTMRTLGVEDRNRRAEMQQKQEALHRFTLRQKMDRDSSKTMFIKDMKERMTRRAVEANMEAARQARKQAEEAEKVLHATYRAQAAPKMAGSMKKNRPTTAK